MKHRASRQLFDYWNDLRGATAAPDRSEVSPAGLRTVLADTFILQIDAGFESRFRLAGTRLCNLFCRELKDQKFASLWEADDTYDIATLVRAVGEDDAAIVLGAKGTSETGRTIRSEMILLPLTLNGKKGKRIVGALSVLDQPFWIGVDPIIRQSIESVRIVMPEEIHRLSQVTPALITPQSPIRLAEQTNIRRYGHLMVLDGGMERSNNR
jgi:hypothetical protein